MNRGVLLASMLSAIVMILSSHASAETTRCDAPPPALGNFATARSGQSLAALAFSEGGEPRTIADYRGRGLVVNFWATWCAPCVREMPALDRLHATLAPDGIAVLALSEDFKGAPVVRKFYARNGIAHLPVATDRRGRLVHRLGIAGLPTTILIDAAGSEVGRVVGPAEWDAPEVVSFVRACVGPAR